MSQLLLPKAAPLKPIPLAPLPERPTVSIVIPSYNQGRFIKATLESILSQDYRPLQIIVMDGGSKDETKSVLESYNDRPEVEWVSEPDKGVVEAVNKGFARVRGEIGAIQSSDDMYLPGTLATIVKEFRQRPVTGLIYGDAIKVDAEGKELARVPTSSFSLMNLFRLKTWIPQPSAFFRKEMLDHLGGWDERIPYAPDTDLWIRMAFRTEVVKLDAFLSARRMHEAQRDTQVAKIARDYSQMIDQSPDIQQAPAEIRRAALASKYLIRVRYNPTHSDWSAGIALLKAGWHDPACLNWRSVFMHLLWLPVRRRLSAIKRLFFSASTREAL